MGFSHGRGTPVGDRLVIHAGNQVALRQGPPFCVPTELLRAYMGTSLTRKRTPLGPYRRPVPRVLGGSKGGGRFRMGEVPL